MATVASLVQSFQRISEKPRAALETAIVGLAAGLAAVAFQIAISKIYGLVFEYLAKGTLFHFAWVTLVSVSVAALFSGWMLHRVCPEAAGSGIPQEKLAYWKEFGHSPRRIALVKFLVGAVSIGGGLSMGREGPSVQIGGNLGSTLAALLGRAKQKKRSASAAGAAAGLAAAFNAPLASIAFVLEEILGDLNSAFLGSALLAAWIGALVVHGLIGSQPAFELPIIADPTWRAYVAMPVVALLAALAGLLFQHSTIWLRGKSREMTRIPRPLQLWLAALVMWAIGIAVFARTGRVGVFSLGYDDLSDALGGQMVWTIAAALLVGKLAGTVLCYGAGGCGGIFSPTLFFGGMVGTVIGGFGSHFLGLTEADRSLLAIGGMSACLAAVVQAPVTALLIIFEMTHQFALVPGLMMAGLISLVTVRAFGRPNFYEEILEQDGHHLEHVVPPRDLRSWQNLPISAVANFQPALVETLAPNELRTFLSGSVFQRFPVVADDGNKLKGVLVRTEAEEALDQEREPKLEAAVTAGPQTSIREAQRLLIESSTGLLIIAENAAGRPLGVVTLHDLLRAQAAMSERQS